MAAPPPYWKKKTRPCPFYSKGRCLFSDACNFVHTVKVNNHHEDQSVARLDAAEPLGAHFHDDSNRSEKAGDVDRDAVYGDAVKEVSGNGYGGDGRSSSRNSLTRTLSRTPSEKRRRVVLMSPPRSPRLSGLLSALEDVIGPDLEEVEVTDEEDEGEGNRPDDAAPTTNEERPVSVPSIEPSPSASERDSTKLAYYRDSPAGISDERSLREESLTLLSSNDGALPDPTTAPPASDFPARPTLRSRVPSPIITRRPDQDHVTIARDDNTLEVYAHSHHPQHHHHPSHHSSHHHNQEHHHAGDPPLTPSRGAWPHSTFELLTSPFANSPAHRILSPQLFAVCDPTSPVFHLPPGSEEGDGKRPRPYGDDDVESLESLQRSSSSSSVVSRDSDSLLRHGGSEETSGSLDTSEYPSEILAKEESQRPASSSSVLQDYAREAGSDELLEFSTDKYHRLKSTSPFLRESSIETGPDGPAEFPVDASGSHGLGCIASRNPLEEASISVLPSEDVEDFGSPQETERPASDYSCTPRSAPSGSIHSTVEPGREMDELPPLPPSAPSSMTAPNIGEPDDGGQPASPPLTEDLSAAQTNDKDVREEAAGGSQSNLRCSASSTSSTLEAVPSGEHSETSTTPSDRGHSRQSPTLEKSPSILDDSIEGYPMVRTTAESICDEASSDIVHQPDGSTLQVASSSSESATPIPHPAFPVTPSRSSLAIDSTSAIRVPALRTDSSEGEEQVHRGKQQELEHWSPKGTDLPYVLDDLMQEQSSTSGDIAIVGKERSQVVQPDSGQRTATLRDSRLRDSATYLAPLSTAQSRGDALGSPATLSFEPSPVTPVHRPVDSADPLIVRESDEDRSAHGSILERRAKHTSTTAKRLTVVSLSSPTKDLRDSFSPTSASLEKTIRPTPSPLYESPQHSASDSAPSSAVSSPRPSWAELQRRAGRSSKVPFGFRQSLLVEESSSLAQKLASRLSNESSASRNSSVSSLSPTSAYNSHRLSRVDVLAGRARSVSPALVGPGPSSHRHSIAPHSNSAPSVHSDASNNMPRSASQAEFFSDCSRSDSPVQLSDPGSSSHRASWMKPLRLSQIYSSLSSHSRSSSTLSNEKRLSTCSTRSSQSHVQNASQGSVVQNTEPLSPRSSLISAYLNDSHIPSHDDRTMIANGGPAMPSMESVLDVADSSNNSFEDQTLHHHDSQSNGAVDQETGSNVDLLSPLSGSMRGLCFDELSRFQWSSSNRNSGDGPVFVTEGVPPDHVESPASYQDTPMPSTPPRVVAANTPIPVPPHAVATPRPDLMFAIASDNPAEVERVLANGEAHPNDVIGPQSALEFALTNDALVNKTEIVKTLLAFGAEPSTLPPDLRSPHNRKTEQGNEGNEEDDILTDLPSENTDGSFSKRRKRDSALNPAMKYYLNRTNAVQTSAALKRSDFRPLARMRFDFVGQDRALEHLYWVLGMHSQQPIGTPLVVLCCGPNGHGKSLLARKFGSLLDVPTHTVNMTVLKTSHDLWDCPSMSPYDPPSERTLAEFLEANAGKRCVVVLDEIDKNEDERTLWSLLAPWELGRCSIDSGRRHIDVRNVIWIGTSNIGQDLVLEHHAARNDPDTVMSKAEYRELMNTLRPLVTEKLGTSLMSRVTAVLPFVPFTPEEKLAIASEAILALGGEEASELSPEGFERLASQCVSEYIESDGARSLYRSVSTHLMEAF